jgi:hypothetical protein
LILFSILGGGEWPLEIIRAFWQNTPQPIGWRRFVNPPVSGRGFLTAVRCRRWQIKAAFAGETPPDEMILELDLSKDGLFLIVRQFPKHAPTEQVPNKCPPTWVTSAASYARIEAGENGKSSKSEIWPPFLDSYRTKYLFPDPEFRQILESVRDYLHAA